MKSLLSFIPLHGATIGLIPGSIEEERKEMSKKIKKKKIT